MARKPSSERIPVGTTDMTADGDTVWLVSEQSNTLTHLDARTGRVMGEPQELPPGNPFAVAADDDAVWIGSRGSRNRNPVQQVLRIDKGTRAVKTFPVSRGVIDLAVSRTAVWVTNARGSSVTRLAKESGDERTIQVGDAPKGVAVGAGLVWVANSGDGTVSVIRSEGSTDRVGQVSVGAGPQLIAYGDGGAWVSLRDTSEVVRVDRSPADDGAGEDRGEPVRAGVRGRPAVRGEPVRRRGAGRQRVVRSRRSRSRSSSPAWMCSQVTRTTLQPAIVRARSLARSRSNLPWFECSLLSSSTMSLASRHTQSTS